MLSLFNKSINNINNKIYKSFKKEIDCIFQNKKKN